MLHLVDEAVYPPNACLNCGGATGPFVWMDTVANANVQTEVGLRPIEGSLYLCSMCATEIVALLGFKSPEDVAALTELLNEQTAIAAANASKAAELERRLVAVG